jgi:uncharacterized protein (UPF0303 family)
MALEDDLLHLALQEERLQFDSFNSVTAFDIGIRLKALVEKRVAKVVIDIALAGSPLFFYAMPGTTPDNVEWIRRKRNVVTRFHKSSLAFALQMQKNSHTLADRFGLSANDCALSGGGFPVRLRGSGCVGSIVVSGLPHRDDHGIIVEVLAELLGHDIAELALAKE